MPKTKAKDDLALFFDSIDGDLESEIQGIVDYINSEMPVDTGALKESWYHEKLKGGGYQIKTNSPYWLPLESGRQPGAKQAPIDPLVGWVERVINPDNPEQVAWAIVKSWVKKGRHGSNTLGFSGDEPGTLNPDASNSVVSQIEALLDNVQGGLL